MKMFSLMSSILPSLAHEIIPTGPGSTGERVDPSAVGIVVIGRNEGMRLERCLRAALEARRPGASVVYVDSGSTDGSPARARALGVDVVELDPARPFTAARGRNAGFRFLWERERALRFVQFLDGDTELVPGWLDAALAALARDPSLAAVCGRRRERAPDATIYNRLCDMEWNTPVGEATTFGGDVMVRADAFERVGGYDARLIAGEDPDLAVRLRKAGFRIQRLDRDMTLHDAAMTTFSQWWKRAMRGGHAFAEGAVRHGDVQFWRKEVRSNWTFGLALPALAVGMSIPTLGTSLLAGASGYAVLFAKVLKDSRRRGMSSSDSSLYAGFATLAKLPQAMGQAHYWASRVRRRGPALIEYK
jgi:GT2 family glycosyltransferase